MQITPILFNMQKARVDKTPSFGALLFKIDHNGSLHDGFFKQTREDKKFRNELLKSMDKVYLKAVKGIKKVSKKNKLVDIVVERRLASKDITVSAINRETGRFIKKPVCIGTKDQTGPVEVENPRKLIKELANCYSQAEIHKNRVQQKY